MTGTPNDMTPGWVCRIRVAGGGITYTSVRLDRDAAHALAAAFERTVDNATGAFVTFTSENGPVKVRADKVSAIEAVPVVSHRYLGAPPPGFETRPVMVETTRR